MGTVKFTEPVSGSSMAADKKAGVATFQYRDAPFDAWNDIDYKSVAAPGTAEVAATTRAVKGFWIVGNPYNNNPVSVGATTSTKATASVAGFRGMPVYPGQAVWFPLSDPVLAYVDNLANDEWAVVYPTHTDS